MNKNHERAKLLANLFKIEERFLPTLREQLDLAWNEALEKADEFAKSIQQPVADRHGEVICFSRNATVKSIRAHLKAIKVQGVGRRRTVKL